MKKLLNIFAYLVTGATIFAFVLSTLGVLIEGPALAKTLGLVGLGLGAVVGLAVGAERQFA